MRQPNGLPHFGKRWSYEEAVQHGAQAFRHARRSTRATIAQLAKWCGRSKRTIAYWLSGEEPLELARVSQNPRLRRHFTRCYNGVDRTEWKGGR